MINRKQLLSYSLSIVLACSMFGGVGFAAHKKKKKDASASSATATSSQTAQESHSKRHRASRESKKEAASTPAAAPASTPAPAAKEETHKATSHRTPPAVTSNASASDIASAKAKGMVWVNTESKVYHTGGKYYGNTKHGKFMTAAEAQKEGYKASKR